MGLIDSLYNRDFGTGSNHRNFGENSNDFKLEPAPETFYYDNLIKDYESIGNQETLDPYEQEAEEVAKKYLKQFSENRITGNKNHIRGNANVGNGYDNSIFGIQN